MEILNAIILGAVQGITEFLPISSSGHLILARDFLGQQVDYGLAFDSVLQLATTLAILVYFRKEIGHLIVSFLKLISGKNQDEKQKRITLAVIIGTIPVVIFGLLLEGLMETAFRNSWVVVGALLVGAAIMFFAEKIGKQHGTISIKSGLVIGLFQVLALIPGMSRSGMTISGGLFSNLKREDATRFSFILAFPVLLGSGLKKLCEIGADGLFSSIGVELLVGSVAAFIVGILAIHLLITYLKRNTLNVFVWYRVLLAAVMIVLLF